MGQTAARAEVEPGGGQPDSFYAQLLAHACERSGGLQEPERCRTFESSRGKGICEKRWVTVGLGVFGIGIGTTSTFWWVWWKKATG